MSQHAKHTTTAKSSHQPATENKILEIGNENAKNLMQAANTCNQMSGELATVCSGSLNSVIEAGGKATHLLQECGNEIIEGGKRSFDIFSDVSKEAFSCKNMEDILKLQDKLVQKKLDNYFNTTSHVYSLLFDGWEEIMKPLNKGTTAAAQQIHNALAA